MVNARSPGEEAITRCREADVATLNNNYDGNDEYGCDKLYKQGTKAWARIAATWKKPCAVIVNNPAVACEVEITVT